MSFLKGRSEQWPYACLIINDTVSSPVTALALGNRKEGGGGSCQRLTEVKFVPFTLPSTLRYMLQRRGHAVDVVRDVALVAEDQVGLVVLQAAPFADGAVQAPPAFLEYHFRHLKTKIRRRMQ
jgi:hypothetical protein